MLPPFIQKIERPIEMPLWQDCAWQRKKCGRETCRFCELEERMKRNARKELSVHLEDMENPADFLHNGPFSDYHTRGYTDNTRAFENRENGECYDVPAPTTYPVYNRISIWHRRLFDIFANDASQKVSWATSEAGVDLIWYSNLLPPKTARILYNRWMLDETDIPAADLIDYHYTRYVVAQCLVCIENSFLLLRTFAEVPAAIIVLHDELLTIATELMEI